MNRLDVRTATPAEQDRVVAALVLAFAADPVSRWSYPEPQQYLTHFPALIRSMGGKAFAHDAAFVVGDMAGAALWLPPDVHPDDAALDAVVLRSANPDHLAILTELFTEMGRYHPPEPHWYLPLLGVDPIAQRQGHGSALLSHTLARIDREHGIAYLDSTNPSNIPLYERHGFEVIGRIQVGDAPPLFPMLRKSR